MENIFWDAVPALEFSSWNADRFYRYSKQKRFILECCSSEQSVEKKISAKRTQQALSSMEKNIFFLFLTFEQQQKTWTSIVTTMVGANNKKVDSFPWIAIESNVNRMNVNCLPSMLIET